jgi:hypothetical protein
MDIEINSGAFYSSFILIVLKISYFGRDSVTKSWASVISSKVLKGTGSQDELELSTHTWYI